MRNKPLKGIYNKPLQGNIVKKVGDTLVNVTEKAGKLFNKGLGKTGDLIKSGITKGFKSYVGTKGIVLTSLPSNLHLHRHAGQEQNKPQQKKGGRILNKLKNMSKNIGDRIDEGVGDVKDKISYKKGLKQYIKQNQEQISLYDTPKYKFDAESMYQANILPSDTILNPRDVYMHNAFKGGRLNTRKAKRVGHGARTAYGFHKDLLK